MEESEFVSIGKIASIFSVSIATLRRWDKSGNLKPIFRTNGGHRRYSIKKVAKWLGISTAKKSNRLNINILYSRVSSTDQRGDLDRQEEVLKTFMRKQGSKSYVSIKDLGSGMNYKKKGLIRLLKLVVSGAVRKIYITHKDRLLRFGFPLIEMIARHFGTKIKILECTEHESFEVTLAKDVLQLLTVFSARLHGKRSHKNRAT
jgi:putative resolvase